MPTAALAIESGCTYIDFLEIDVECLPHLWWSILRTAVNDYLYLSEENEYWAWAQEWLFFEEEDPCLDDECKDMVSLHIVAKAFDIDIKILRFLVQCLKDNPTGEMCEDLEYRVADDPRDPRGLPKGYLTEKGFTILVARCGWQQRIEEELFRDSWQHGWKRISTSLDYEGGDEWGVWKAEVGDEEDENEG